MNRHERRAAEARARAASMDKGFSSYRAQARRAFPDITDRDLGESWMRRQAWLASGIDCVVIHKKGENPIARSTSDVVVSVAYGSLEFRAVIDPDLFRVGAAGWERKLAAGLDAGMFEPGDDRREVSRRFILGCLVTQRYGEVDAARMAAAVSWLIAGSPAGEIFTGADCPFTRFHYEITDIEDDSGRRGQNFRLVLGSADEPLPDVVHVLPPHPINEIGDVHPLPPIEDDDAA
jgi:hypothetical protein